MRRLLKTLRYSWPLNAAATTATRAALSLVGLRGDWAVRHLHRVGPVSSLLPNGRTLRLWSRADDWVSNQVFWRGWTAYEPETAALFFRLAARALSTFDVGAYVGFFSLLAGHANPAGGVVAFEPLQRAFDRLTENVSRNCLRNVECVQTAVGCTLGKAVFFHVEQDGIPCSSSLSFEFMRGAPDLRRADVPVVTLDTFARERGISRVELLKIDTESTEPDVLRGAMHILRRDQPLIVCEVLKGRGTERPLEELLKPLGYHFYLLTPTGPSERDAIEGHPEWLNYLFAPMGPGQVARL